jgi:uncharacterized protein (DUF1800 family)
MGKSKSSAALNRRNFLGAGAAVGLAGLSVTQSAKAAAPKFEGKAPLRPAPIAKPAGAVAPPPLAALVLNKAAYGPRPGDVEAFNALPGDDDNKLALWLDNQLNPSAADPDIDLRMDNLAASAVPEDQAAYDTIDELTTTPQQLWQDYARNDDYSIRNRPVWQMERLTILRAAYSEWQLREVLYDFWFNHFNVYGREFPTYGMMPEYDRNVRDHIFGNFGDMLRANAKTATMLYYLDNYANTWPRPNENYAREVLELHTLGAVENYYGAVDPLTVGDNGKGQRAGYTEIDVFEFAKALTGWGVSNNPDIPAEDTGAFVFRADRHYNDWLESSIKVLDIELTETNGEDDVTEILDYLAGHFGTAKYIAWKLCTRLIGDNPDPGFVTLVAEQFYTRQNDSDQLKEVYRFIITSPQFKNSWGNKVTRPVESLARAWRASGVDLTFRIDHSESNSIWYRLDDTSHYPFGYAAPTGFPDERAFWQGSGPLIMTWRCITYMLRRDALVNQAQQTNNRFTDVNERTPRKIVHWWINRAMGYDFPIEVENRIVKFVTDITGDLDSVSLENYTDTLDVLNVDNTAKNTTYQQIIRGVVGLILMSPDAMRR